MSEKFPGTHHEHLPSPEPAHEHHVEHAAKHHEQHHHKAEKAPTVEQARLRVEQAEKQAEKSHKAETPDSSDRLHEPRQHYVNRELKEMAYSRLLNRTRKHLSPAARTFSKFVHQPAVNAASEALGKSVGRPSGVFGGGLVALLGTSVYYYLTKHYGYTYNYFVFVLLLLLGFLVGWTLELAWKLSRATKS